MWVDTEDGEGHELAWVTTVLVKQMSCDGAANDLPTEGAGGAAV